MQEKAKQYSKLGRQMLIRAYNAVWNAIVNLFKTSPIQSSIENEKTAITFIPGSGKAPKMNPFPSENKKKK